MINHNNLKSVNQVSNIIHYLLRDRHLFAVALIIGVLAYCLGWSGRSLQQLQPSASAVTNSMVTETIYHASSSAVSPGEISFKAQSFSVDEGGGSADIALTRTVSKAGVLSAKIALAPGTASLSDDLLAQGAIDSTFTNTAPLLGFIYGNSSIALQPDGKVLMGDIRGVWRLNADGSLDTTFNAGQATNNRVSAVAVQSDGKVLIGGGFTTFNNQGVRRIARLHPDGSLDNTFNAGTGPDDDVNAIAVQQDGRVLIAGLFNSFNGTQRFGVARLNTNGSLDTSYGYQSSYTRAIVLQPDGKALMGGSKFNKGVERVNTDGTIDNTFNRISGASNVLAVALQPDGKVLIGGNFDHVDGQVAYNVARLNTNGSFDPTFATGTGTDNAVTELAIQPDGKVLIGGGFKSYQGESAVSLARLNTNGSLDPTFASSLVDFSGTSVEAIVLQPDGRVIVGGYFTASGAGDNRSNLARFNNELFVTWEDGDDSDKTVRLAIVDDLLDETDETLGLTLVPLTSGVSTGAYPGATLTITDDDLPPQITISNVAITEGDTTAVGANFTVSLSTASGRSVRVKYQTADNTALTPEDYTALPLTTLTFSPGQTTKTVRVLVKGDSLDEANETFKVNLSDATNATIADSQGVGVINDNDQAPSLSVNNATVTETNTGVNTSAAFVVSLSTPSGKAVSFNYSTANGTAIASADYTPASGTLTFSPGQTTTTVGVAVRGDQVDEANETFELLLSSPKNATLAVSQATATINDNDPPPSITITDASVTEPDADGVNATFTVKLSAASGQYVSLKYQTGGGTATANTDYTKVALTTLTFRPGQVAKTFTVQVRGDTISELNETFFVTLSSVVNATIQDSRGMGTIINDD